MSDTLIEKAKYLLMFLDWYIEHDIYGVLENSEEDPHHSAVTTVNLIKCYIDVSQALNQPLPYNSVEDFLRFKCFSEEEIREFECRRQREAVHYTGKQY